MSRPIHIDGDYCRWSENFFDDATRAVEAKDAIEPDPAARWRWKPGICPTCTKAGGVLLFNRAIAELRAFENGTEDPAVTERRAARALADERRRENLATKAGRKAERERKRGEREQKRGEREARKAHKAAQKAAQSVAYHRSTLSAAGAR